MTPTKREINDRSANVGSSVAPPTNSSLSVSARRGAALAIPSISIPKGGGAVKGLGEKFTTNPSTGTASFDVPLAVPPGRDGFGPKLTLQYNSGGGNGPWGVGWQLSMPSIFRKTDKGVPRYDDAIESDTFILAGAEDLVPAVVIDSDGNEAPDVAIFGDFTIRRYRPRIEGAFSRIERWCGGADRSTHWRVTSRDNITSVYGASEQTRIADPADPERVFSWLLQETRDDRGNVICYVYKQEDGANVDANSTHEQHRFRQIGATKALAANAQRYLKQILYGNKAPILDSNGAQFTPLTALANVHWCFDVKFDWGEHGGETTPQYVEKTRWPVRRDPFSTYRQGFELRSFRLCRRILVFHRFDELDASPRCVSTMNFGYDEQPTLSSLTSIESLGLDWASARYLIDRSSALPPVRLNYSKAQAPVVRWSSQPNGTHHSAVTGDPARWVDLDGEGIPGVLWADGRGWFYERNLGDGVLADPIPCKSVPSHGDMQTDLRQLTDIDGDGRLDLVKYTPEGAGFFARDDTGGWLAERMIPSVAHIDWLDPNLRMVDLSGDGFADILITRDDHLLWVRSKGAYGFAAAERVLTLADEDLSPRVLFADGTETLFLADMNGDGLTDIVRIRNGSVCYWPSLGYARFGAKVTLSDCPVFDAAERFDPKRIRLGDFDGSGCVDIAYLKNREVLLYANQAGNALSKHPTRIETLPDIDNTSSIELVDAFGHGTSCLVWSSQSLHNVSRPLQITDLTGGVKPYLLTGVDNGYGGTIEIEYTTSTSQYLADKAQGKSWLTRLPFPVHVVSRVTRRDDFAGTRLATTYAYRHGYFDGVEREFRGFGFVEQVDDEIFSLENLAPSDRAKPVVTRTWFHTGAWLESDRLESGYAAEYYGGDTKAVRLRDTQLPTDLSPAEQREAVRALKGRALRVEVYAMDAEGGRALNPQPYSVSERTCLMRCLQRKNQLPHAVFHAYESEALQYHYEREPADPRVTHELALAADTFGNITRNANIAYPRRLSDHPEQVRCWATVSHAWFVNDVGNAKQFRVGVPIAESRYELVGLKPAAGEVLAAAALDAVIENAVELPLGSPPPSGSVKRLLELRYHAFWDDQIAKELPIGEIGQRALPHRQYALAFSQSMLDSTFGTDKKLASLLSAAQSGLGYVRPPALSTDAHLPPAPASSWWRTSGVSTPSKAAFYQPIVHTDTFGAVTNFKRDVYSLHTIKSIDPRGNITAAKYDYRVLAPNEITDSNNNVSHFAFETNGKLTAVALAGKGEGDTLATPTKSFTYELNRRAEANSRRPPMRVITRERTRHAGATFDINAKVDAGVRETYLYTDGSGREALTMLRAEPGDVPALAPDGRLMLKADGTVATIKADSRWVGSGRMMYDNKGNPVRKYEPFFWPDAEFPPDPTLRQWGVTPVMHYDPVGRLFRTDNADGTHSRITFGAWHVERWDENDTVVEPLVDPAPGQTSWYSRMCQGTPEMRRAAEQSALHKATPHVELFDAMGRAFLSFTEEKDASGTVVNRFETRTAYDIDGRVIAMFDAEARPAARNEYDLLGRPLAEWLADSGKRLTLLDVADQVARQWTERGFVWRNQYDALRRITHRYVYWPKNANSPARSDAGSPLPADENAEEVGGISGWLESLFSPSANDDGEPTEHGGQEILAERIYYGEDMGDVQQARDVNALGRVVAQFDDAGLMLHIKYDFKGNLQGSSRQVSSDFRSTTDWTVLAIINEPYKARQRAASLLESESHVIAKEYDALDRVTQETAPDGSISRPSYNDAGLLEAVEVEPATGGTPLSIIRNIDYNARGQRIRIEIGCQVETRYEYDPLSFRLISIKSWRTSSPSRPLQHLLYTYDAVGNIVSLRDQADPNHFFKGNVVSGDQEFSYDTLYQLTQASGREHPYAPPSARDPLKDRIPHPTDLQALRRYSERYSYDRNGNIMRVEHDSGARWIRNHSYEATNNRLRRVEGSGPGFEFEHDAHGNITAMPHLVAMHWDGLDRLKHAARNDQQRVWYAYDASGQRVRKVFENQQTVEETLYFGEHQIYRRRAKGRKSPSFERKTLHVVDGNHRAAMIETVTVDRSGLSELDSPNVRYQLCNHLGSSTAELDGTSRVMSYEEYHPFGSSAFIASRAPDGASRRGYRFTGKERDSETGLDYFGARYYAPWLCRWISADPSGFKDSLNRYSYVGNSPAQNFDRFGLEATDHSESFMCTPQDLSGTGTARELPRLKASDSSAYVNRDFGEGHHLYHRAYADYLDSLEIGHQITSSGGAATGYGLAAMFTSDKDALRKAAAVGAAFERLVPLVNAQIAKSQSREIVSRPSPPMTRPVPSISGDPPKYTRYIPAPVLSSADQNTFTGGRAPLTFYVGPRQLNRLEERAGNYFSAAPLPRTELEYRMTSSVSAHWSDLRYERWLDIPAGVLLSGYAGTSGSIGGALFGGRNQIYLDQSRIPSEWQTLIPVNKLP